MNTKFLKKYFYIGKYRHAELRNQQTEWSTGKGEKCSECCAEFEPEKERRKRRSVRKTTGNPAQGSYN
jgi:hypothetical protein